MNRLDAHAKRLLAKAQTPGRRFLLAIAGIPGSGKSTLADGLCERLNASEAGVSIVLPMDGFHLTNNTLRQHDLADRKGSPETFDVDGYAQLLRQARDPLQTPSFPVYDRKLHDPVWRDEDPAQQVGRRVRIVITEGNYLLLELPPWDGLASIFDETWMTDTPVEIAKQRLIARHINGGRSPSDAAAHYQAVDYPNAMKILKYSRSAHMLVNGS